MSCWQDPLRGGRDKMLEEIASVIHSEDPDVSADQLVVPAARRLVPEFMLKLAGRVSPFWRWWWFVIAARTRCNCKDYCTLGGSSLSLIGSCIRGVFFNEEKYFWSLISDSIPKQCFKGGKARRDELGTPAQSRWEATDLLYTSIRTCVNCLVLVAHTTDISCDVCHCCIVYVFLDGLLSSLTWACKILSLSSSSNHV